MALPRQGSVVFYHPLDDATERTQSEAWVGTASWVPGKVGAAAGADPATFGPEAELEVLCVV